jgi:hypothetical protein
MLFCITVYVFPGTIKCLVSGGERGEGRFYRNVGHGFALGTGTSVEGWVTNALRFWEAQGGLYNCELLKRRCLNV